MANPLTNRQKKVLECIRTYVARKGVTPTHREIAERMGNSGRTGVAKHLVALEREGHIQIRAGESRSIRLLESLERQIPVYGKVAAGKPIEVSEHTIKTVVLPQGLFRKDPDYLLLVQGDSMEDEKIFDGDFAAVKRAQTADAGQIVVAHVDTSEMSREEMRSAGLADSGITLKRLGFAKGRVLLKSANRARAYSPLLLEPEQINIQGIFLGTVRVV